MIPPRGFKAEQYPLTHKFFYSFGLSAGTTTMNSCWITLVRSTKDIIAGTPESITVNPHGNDVMLETGPACSPMSIIDKLSLTLTFVKTLTDEARPMKIIYQPFFCQFPEKYDAADINTTTTVASIMQLTKDATNEDIVPLTTNKLPVIGNSDTSQPITTHNILEDFGDYNMTTNLTMEDTPFDHDAFQKLLAYGTNKGALRSCLGRRRQITMDRNNMSTTHHFNKFVPRSIRRIMPYTYFGILFHMPVAADQDSYYASAALTANLAHIGIKAAIRYHEWNPSHNQDISNT